MIEYQVGTDLGTGPYLLVPIPRNSNGHHINASTSFSYLYDVSSCKSYLINHTHNDYTLGDVSAAYKHLSERETFVFSKFVPRELKNYKSVELLHWIQTNESIEVSVPNDIKIYQSWYRDIDFVNDVTPIVNWVDYLENIKEIFLEDYKSIEEVRKPLEFYQKMQNNFLEIERNGMKTLSGFKHSDFNYYTSTGRPSNAHAGFNFAAMDKEDGTRKQFISRHKNGVLIEFDYESFHIRLAANVIGYNLPKDESAHIYFGKQYFGKENLTSAEIDESKTTTFRLFYGEKVKGAEDTEFFGQIYKFRDKLWNEFNEKGYIELPLSGRKLKKENYSDMRESKLFNYFMQAHETEVNSLTLCEINKYLLNRNTKIILYTYDSVLFDVDINEGSEVTKKIKEILELGGYPTSIKYGLNYHKMKKYGK